MKKIISMLCVLLLLVLGLTACTDVKPNGAEGNGTTQNKPESGNNEGDGDGTDKTGNVLIAYFSCTNTTAGLAATIATETNGKLYEIVPAIPYTADDLKYYTDCRADREQADATCRPKISGKISDIENYDIVFIGYPIWHGQAPKIIYTFLESYDFSGKTIIPFCTSASSGLGSSASNLHALAPNAEWKSGQRFSGGTNEPTIKSWIDGLNLNIKEEGNVKTVNVYVGSKSLEIELADNASASAFAEKLKDGDVIVTMDDYGNFEKVGSLNFSLPRTDTQITTSPGDVILYLGTNVTIYYDINSYNFTLLGKIKNMTRETMLQFFGGMGEVTVRFSLD